MWGTTPPVQAAPTPAPTPPAATSSQASIDASLALRATAAVPEPEPEPVGPEQLGTPHVQAPALKVPQIQISDELKSRAHAATRLAPKVYTRAAGELLAAEILALVTAGWMGEGRKLEALVVAVETDAVRLGVVPEVAA